MANNVPQLFRLRHIAEKLYLFFFLPKMLLPASPSSSPMEAANWRSSSFWWELRSLGTFSCTETN